MGLDQCSVSSTPVMVQTLNKSEAKFTRGKWFSTWRKDIPWQRSRLMKPKAFCAVIFYFNYTCCVKKINKKLHETKTIIIYTFTVQLYNVSTRSNTLKIVYTAGLASPRRTVFKSKVHDKICFICKYTELRLKYKGFDSDCNRKTQFILQCTRQLCSVCQVCGVHQRAQTLVGWPV